MALFQLKLNNIITIVLTEIQKPTAGIQSLHVKYGFKNTRVERVVSFHYRPISILIGHRIRP